jgi:hypothetical protein
MTTTTNPPIWNPSGPAGFYHRDDGWAVDADQVFDALRDTGVDPSDDAAVATAEARLFGWLDEQIGLIQDGAVSGADLFPQILREADLKAEAGF